MLAVRGVDAFYGASHVLHGLTFEAARGELVALLGRNGAGKTTTFAALMGLVRTEGGVVAVDGDDLAGLATDRRAGRGLALVPSGARVFPNLSVQENLEVVRPGPAVHGEPWSVARILEQFPRLAELRSRAAGNLSGGERQMLAVGRGLAANPKVLLLDEPSEGLAPVTLQAIGELIAGLKGSGLTIVLAEQNHRFALRHADRAYLIEKGAIRHEARGDELAGSAALHRYLGV